MMLRQLCLSSMGQRLKAFRGDAWPAGAVRRASRYLAGGAVMLAVLILAGCSVLPPRSLVTDTVAIDPALPSTLRRVASASLLPGFDSGFALLPVASGDYEARLALINLAERSLDVQTFYWGADDTGTYLLDRMRSAASRGVRMRLLVDDLNSAGTDDTLRAFSNERNVEVRLFNPFAMGRSSTAMRLLSSLNELGRVNHRMHNKLFVADNAIAIFGGRNTGDEYFMRAKTGNFVDFDAIGAGRVVPELSNTFDLYWNSSYAFPVTDIVPRGELDTEKAFRQKLYSALPPNVDETVPMLFQPYTTAATDMSAGRLQLIPGSAEVVADPVDKISGTRLVNRAGTVRAYIGEIARTAKKEVLIVSPYFVPGELGMDAMRQLRASGVTVRVLTNSLAATDEPSVYAGYLRYRKQLLELGIEIYELSPGLTRRTSRLGRFSSSQGMLHMKIAVFDRTRLFVGSMNLDERSERYNTELGVLIDSPELASSYIDLVSFEGSAYRLRLDPATGQTQWVEGEGADEQVFTVEPETTWWLRTKSMLMGGLVPEGWL